MADMGYDVSDHRDIDPLFGTLADFDALIARAHVLGLKVIIDQVLSHTSDRHPWFVESRRAATTTGADWYVWADPRPTAARRTTGSRSSAARPGPGTAVGGSTTCTTSSPPSRT
jgi:glycosidase